MAAAFLPFGLGVAFFLGAGLAALAALAAGFFAVLVFFLGLLVLGLLAAAGLLALGLAVFLAEALVAFFTPRTSSQMSDVNGRAGDVQQAQQDI